jgi:hypothetical protein
MTDPLSSAFSSAILDNMRLDPDKHLHSKEHLLADDLSRSMLEPKKFAAYLGIAKLYYESDLRALAKYVLQKADLPREARGKYFFAAVKGLSKKPGVKFKRRKKRKDPPSRKATEGKAKQNVKNNSNRTRTGKGTS